MNNSFDLKTCTRKQFLIGSSVVAAGLLCGPTVLRAQPGATAPFSGTPESPENVPNFPEPIRNSIERA